MNQEEMDQSGYTGFRAMVLNQIQQFVEHRRKVGQLVYLNAGADQELLTQDIAGNVWMFVEELLRKNGEAIESKYQSILEEAEAKLETLTYDLMKCNERNEELIGDPREEDEADPRQPTDPPMEFRYPEPIDHHTEIA